MYWPDLVHNSCLLIILCGLTTIGNAVDPYDTIIERRNAAAAVATAAVTAAASHSAHAQANVPSSHPHPSTYTPSSSSSSSASAASGAQPTKNIASTTVYHHGSGSHNIESVSRNSYTMLSQAMSHAVNHEFSKCFYQFRTYFNKLTKLHYTLLLVFFFLGFFFWVCFYCRFVLCSIDKCDVKSQMSLIEFGIQNIRTRSSGYYARPMLSCSLYLFAPCCCYCRFLSFFCWCIICYWNNKTTWANQLCSRIWTIRVKRRIWGTPRISNIQTGDDTP